MSGAPTVSCVGTHTCTIYRGSLERLLIVSRNTYCDVYQHSNETVLVCTSRHAQLQALLGVGSMVGDRASRTLELSWLSLTL